MPLVDIFYQGEGLDDIQHLELDETSTISEFKKLIYQKHHLTGTFYIFREDSDELIDDVVCLSELCGDSKLKIHFHRHRRIEVCVSFNGEEVGKKFSPSATVNRVKHWAARRKFDMTREEAGEHVLQLSGGHDRPHPGVHIGTLVKDGCVKLEFDLVPDQRINGYCGVTV